MRSLASWRVSGRPAGRLRVARGGNPYARRDPERAPKHRRAERLREPLFESRSGEVRQRCQPRRVTARNAASARATLPRPRTAAVEAGRSDCDAGANLRSARRAADLTAFPGRNGPAVATHGTSPVSIGASACAHVAVAGPVAMTICLCFWLHQPLGPWSGEVADLHSMAELARELLERCDQVGVAVSVDRLRRQCQGDGLGAGQRVGHRTWRRRRCGKRCLSRRSTSKAAHVAADIGNPATVGQAIHVRGRVAPRLFRSHRYHGVDGLRHGGPNAAGVSGSCRPERAALRKRPAADRRPGSRPAPQVTNSRAGG
jgi:hypothetical protein